MRRLIERARESLRGGFSLVLGTVVAQLIALAALPVISRIYSAEAFGYLSLVTAVASLLIPVAGLRLESALMLPDDDRSATAIFAASSAAAFVVSLLTFGCLELVFALGGLPEMADLPFFSAWVSGIVFLASSFILVSQFALRHKAYGDVAQRNIHQSVASAVAQVTLGFLPGGVGLLVGYSFGRFVGVVPILVKMRTKFRAFRISTVRSLLVQYWRFPLLFTPSAFLNAIGLTLPLIFVGAWFGVPAAGQWGMATQILAAPVLLVGAAAGQYVEAEASALLRSGRNGVSRLLFRTGVLLTAAGAVLALVVGLWAPWVLDWVLGSGWGPAGAVAQAMALMAATRLIAVALTKVLIVFQRAQAVLILDVMRVLLLGASVYACIVLKLSLVEAAWVTSMALTVVYVVTCGWAFVAARRHDSSPDDRRHLV